MSELQPLLLSIEDAGRLLGLGRTKLYELMDEGEIPTVSIGRRRFIAADDIRAYVDRLRGAK